MKGEVQLDRSKLNCLPRATYDKSTSYRNTYEPRFENSENETPLRSYITASPAGKQKRDYELIVREESKRYQLPSSAQEMIYRKLDSPANFGKDGWSTSKLESIQNRIHSVLKESNK